MKKHNRSLCLVTLGSMAVLALNACTNATTQAGSVNTYYDGTITDMEAVDLDTNRNDTGTNTLLGAVGGALIGNLIGKNSTGTLVGAGVGALAAGGASKLANRHDGVRLTIDSENGPLIVDMPFSCKYEIGKKVRLISNSSSGSVMVDNGDGHFTTATEDSYKKCPALYEKIRSN
ncbi:MAG: YMGG-like glycine zipper-containing protein [Succinivibrio sp.]